MVAGARTKPTWPAKVCKLKARPARARAMVVERMA